jgi:hypothetical protein
MKDNQILKDYILVKEISRDSFGKSFLARKINKNKTEEKYIVVRLHDFIASKAENHDLIKNYVKEIGKSSVPNILRPVDLIFDNDNILLVYPYIRGKNLKTIIDHLERSSVELPFKTVVETVLKIAVIVDMGSMVILNNQPSYHGLLIPENILVGYDGEIYLKYYGMLPFISSSSYSFIKENYRIWLAPELLMRDEIHYRSEIYYLGHIVYRILTGKYFPLEPGNFENAVTNISFNKTIPSTNTTFLSNLLEFFKNTLHPAVDQRIKSFDLFTSYISEKFSISNTYSVKANLSAVLDKLFKTGVKEGDTVPVSDFKEADSSPAVTITKKRIDPQHLKEKITPKKKSKALPVLISIVALSLIAILTIFVLDTQKEKPVNEVGAVGQPVLKNNQESGGMENQAKNISNENNDQLSEPGDKESGQMVAQEQNEGEGQIDEMTGKETSKTVQNQNKEKEQMGLPDKTVIEEQDNKLIKNKKKTTKKKSGSINRSRTQNIKTTPTRKSDKIVQPENQKKIFSINELTDKPRRIRGVIPVFKYEMKKYHLNGPGKVSVNILLDENGKVCKVELLTEVNTRISSKICEALLKWKYTPAIRDGRAVKTEVPVSVSIEFESIPIVSLSELSGKPHKKKGKILFSKEIRRNYIGRRRTVKVKILVNHHGRVEQIKLQSLLPDDLAKELKKNITKWVYSIPMKDQQKVKVWLQETLRINIK